MDCAAKPPKNKQPIIISGPSGVGKGTIRQKLLDSHPDIFTLSVSHTTRSPRVGEVEGVDYYYVSQSDFTTLVSHNGFMEYTSFGGNFYGTSRQTIAEQMAKGQVVLIEVEMEGVKQIKADLGTNLEPRYVFIKPPTFEMLEARLRNRATESEEDIQKRLSQARNELQFANSPDAYDKIIVNDDLENAYKELLEFIYSTPASCWWPALVSSQLI